jgi:hypothetical protein
MEESPPRQVSAAGEERLLPATPSSKAARLAWLARILCWAVSLSLSLWLWFDTGYTTHSPTARQLNAGLFEIVDRFAAHIDSTPDPVVFIVTQDQVLLWRKIAYRLVPRRAPMLPHTWVDRAAATRRDQIDPPNGCWASLGCVHFSGPEKLAVFARANKVTHLLIAAVDANVMTAVGLALDPGQMYLLRFDPQTASFVQVDNAPLP